jgi:hypothetical protein
MAGRGGRAHAVVEDRVRADKAMGLRNLPSKDWTVNQQGREVNAVGASSRDSDKSGA